MNRFAGEVSLRYKSNFPKEEMPVITTPDVAAEYLRSIWDQGTIELREEFIIVLLNNRKKCLGYSKISIGSSTGTVVEPAAVFQPALLGHAQSIILAHNHPSGHCSPSRADLRLTKRLQKAGELLGITIDDQIIITKTSHYSFRSSGDL